MTTTKKPTKKAVVVDHNLSRGLDQTFSGGAFCPQWFCDCDSADHKIRVYLYENYYSEFVFVFVFFCRENSDSVFHDS